MRFRRPRRALPGFELALAATLLWAGVLVALPFLGLAGKMATVTWEQIWASIADPRVVASYRISFGLALVAALLDVLFGGMLAWALVRYHFPGKRLVDALVDLPFALPTAVAGLALTALYAPTGLLGKPLNDLFGIQVAYTPLGVLVALVFVGFPFTVRAVQPVLADVSADLEEAAACLGATRGYVFRRVVLPALFPALLTGGALAFGRAVGEFGSVVFISGNLPFRTEITPLLIIVKLEQFDYAGAASIGSLMILVSLAILLAVRAIEERQRRRLGLGEGI